MFDKFPSNELLSKFINERVTEMEETVSPNANSDMAAFLYKINRSGGWMENVREILRVVITGRQDTIVRCNEEICRYPAYDAKKCHAFYGKYCQRDQCKFILQKFSYHTSPEMLKVWTACRLYEKENLYITGSKAILGEARYNHYLAWLSREAYKEWLKLPKKGKAANNRLQEHLEKYRYMNIEDLKTDPWFLFTQKEHKKKAGLMDLNVDCDIKQKSLFNFVN